jgi:CRP-like cAMP-binding protein
MPEHAGGRGRAALSITDLLAALYVEEVGAVTGPLGVGIYLIAYFLLQIGKLRGHGYIYPALVITAAGCVLYTQQGNFNGPSAMIQASFIVISLIGIGQLVVRRCLARFTPDERALLASRFPDLDPGRARRLLAHGRWTRVRAGTVLCTFDQPVDGLLYVARGTVRCSLGDRDIYSCRDGFFVGEESVLTGAPATSRCVAETPLHCFRLDAARLRKLTRKDVVMRLAVHTAIAEEVRCKLVLAEAAHRTVLDRLARVGRVGDTAALTIDFARARQDGRDRLAPTGPDVPGRS